MATLTTQNISLSAIIPTYANASGGGDKVRPGPRTFLHVKNASGASITVTVDDTKTPTPEGATGFDPDLKCVIAGGSEKMVGPIVEGRFRGTDGLAAVTYSSATSVTIAVLKV